MMSLKMNFDTCACGNMKYLGTDRCLSCAAETVTRVSAAQAERPITAQQFTRDLREILGADTVTFANGPRMRDTE